MVRMKGKLRDNSKVFLLAGLLCYIVLASFVASFEQGENNRNVSVDTTVNITESLPVILAVSIEDGATNITLNAGSERTVVCNVSALDYNGGSTLSANATFYHDSVTSTASDDNNTHYTNESCAVIAGETSNEFRNFSCSFPIQYYANTGTWYCEVTVADSFGFADNASNTTNIDQLLALNVTTLIDYGDLAVGDVSTPQEANVTNLGNTNINVSVLGYGGQANDGLAFVCDQGNISIEWEKYNITNNGQDVNRYYNLSGSFNNIPGLAVAQQTNDSEISLNATYWLLEVPPNPFGVCNGTIVFQAEQS